MGIISLAKHLPFLTSQKKGGQREGGEGEKGLEKGRGISRREKNNNNYSMRKVGWDKKHMAKT